MLIYVCETQANLAWYINTYNIDPYEIVLDAHTEEVLHTETELVCE